MSQRAVAERLGIDETKLTKSLRGVRKFSSLELALIAELGMRSVEWILHGETPRAWAFAHRAVLLDREAADSAGRDVVASVAERYDAAIDLGFVPAAVELPAKRKFSRYIDEANSLAAEAYRMLSVRLCGLETSELMSAVEEAFGVNVIVAALPYDCDGLSYEDSGFRAIVLASTDRTQRQRYTLAHELGHLLWGDARDVVVEENIDRKSKSHDESRADVFAASFLMPASEIREALGESSAEDAFAELVWAFGVSPVSMAWRLLNLQLIDEVTQARLGRRSSSAVANELGVVDDQLRRGQQSALSRPPSRLLAFYTDAYLNGDIGVGPLAALLHWTRDEVAAFFDDSELTTALAKNPESVD